MKIFLIGFMGTGKTFWGKKWAQRLNYFFIDLDEKIEEKVGLPITAIFESKGETYFRELETLVLKEMIDQNNVIIACGGGTPCFHNNMKWMNEHGKTVYLSRTPTELFKHVARETNKRPLLKDLNDTEILNFIEQKLQDRLPFYTQASITLHSDHINEDSIDKIVNFEK